MRSSPILGVQVPDASDVADVPTDLYRIVTSLESKTIPVFASAAARNSAFAAAGVTATDGLRCFLNDTKTTQIYLGGVWLNQESAVVCTASSRPNPSHVGMQIYESDTKMYRTWDGTVWKQSSPGVSTSATRATALHSGQQTYDTDTKELRYWDGANWVATGIKNVGPATQGSLVSPFTAATASSQMKMICKSEAVTTDANGEASINFGYTFTGIGNILLTNGDGTVGGANQLAFLPVLQTMSLSGFVFRMYRESVTVYGGAGGVDRYRSTACRVNYTVFGW